MTPVSTNVSLKTILSYPDLTGPTSDSASHAKFIASLRAAMVGLGFFYLADSPLERERERVLELSRSFFDQSVEERRSINQEGSRHFRGYSDFGTEYTLHKQDNREQIDMGIESPALPPSITSSASYLNLWGPNQFPASPPDLKEVVLRYLSAAEQITIRLTAALEEALGVPAGRLQDQLGLEHKEEAFEAVRNLTRREEAEKTLSAEEIKAALPEQMPYARMKIVRYGSGGNQQGVGPHRDGGWITLLATDDNPGLQVEDVDGSWIDVPYRPGCILVNFGQQLERISGGLINAATHRVQIYPTPTPRISFPYFAMPNLRALIVPIDKRQVSQEVLKESGNLQVDSKGSARITSVPEKDLHGGEREEAGWSAWRGIIRSHPATYQRWYGPEAS